MIDGQRNQRNLGNYKKIYKNYKGTLETAMILQNICLYISYIFFKNTFDKEVIINHVQHI
jgi:hypothetical protein